MLKESEMIINRPNYMVKIVRSRALEVVVDAEIPGLVVAAADEAIKKLGLGLEYILLIIVPGDHVTGLIWEFGESDDGVETPEDGPTGISEGNPEHSLYMNGLDTIIIAGVIPEQVEKAKWLKAVRRSLLQDFILHWAYTTGAYDEDSKDSESYLEFLISERLKEFDTE